MNRSLAVAVGRYAHVEDLVDGHVHVDGLDLQFVRPATEHALQRMLHLREWEVSEFSFAQFVALRSQGDDSLVAIPVFPSRVFRHGSIFVRRDGGLTEPAALSGARVGIPEWVQTAGVWMRGILSDEYGVDLSSIAWVQAGVNEPGRLEGIQVDLPRGITCTARPEACLDELLRRGELDAVLSARPPASFTSGDGEVVRLFSDPPAVERDWWERTGVFPIMHVLVLRRDVYEQARWIAQGLLEGFTESKRRSVAALADRAISTIPMPWIPEKLSELSAAAGGGEWWPYGVHENIVTLEVFLRYCREQGIASEKLDVGDLFARETLTAHVRV